MQKVKTVRRVSFIFAILLTIVSCQKEQQSDDQRLLELVLQLKQNQPSKTTILLNPTGDSKVISKFFKLREKKSRTFTVEYLDSISSNDTLSPRKGKAVYKDLEITSNNYISWGKGIDKKTEDFLKDSFNYKKNKIVHWLVPKSLKNISLKKKNLDNGKNINISSPAYNLDKNKAILFTFEQSHKNTATQSIYFIEKKNNTWNIIYTESQDMFLDLRIE